MIVGPRAASGLLPRAAALALAAGAALTATAGATGATAATAATGGAAAGASVAVATPGGTGTAAGAAATTGSWAPAWSWRSVSGGLPKGCTPYSGRTSGGMRWSPSLVRIVDGRLRLATTRGTGRDDVVGSGVGCTGLAQRYGRLEVRARMPQGAGLVGRIALWPSTPSRGSDWSGLTVPSADVSSAYATNGCGDEAYGAAVPGHLTGAFHDYLITWSPQGFSVAIDGRTLYRDDKSFDRPRWLGISLAATGRSSTGGHLLVEKMAASTWTGPMTTATTGPADTHAPGSAPGGQDAPDTMAPLAGAANLSVDGDGGLAPSLELTRPSTPWLIAGGLAAVGVLFGVVRAARAARRRPLVPR